MAFTLSPLYGQAGSYTAQQDRLNLQAMTVTGGVRKLTTASGGAMTGDLSVTTTGTGNASVNVSSGLVVIPWTTATNQGHYLALNDASTVVGTFAACPTNTRIDLVVVTVTDTGSASPSFAFAITQGTAAASPTAPSTPANSIVLASILVPTGFTTGSTIAALSITDLRTKAFLPDLSSNSTINAAGTTLSNVPSPVSGNVVYSDVGDHLVAYNGSSWDAVPQTSGYRNALINGAFNVDEQQNKGGAQTFTAGAALAYSVDRWYGYCTGANVTGQQVTGAGVDQFYYQFTGAVSNSGIGFGQRIENINAQHFTSQQATLSVKLKSSNITTVTWTASYANSFNNFGSLASPTVTQIATGTFTINSTMSRYQATFAVPAALATSTSGIEIRFTTGALLATQTLAFGTVQLELGAIATPFERKSYGTELSLCQRYSYLMETTGGVTKFMGFAQGNSTTQWYLLVTLPHTFRTDTTSTTLYIAGSSFTINGNLVTGTPTLSSGSNRTMNIFGTIGAANLIFGQSYIFSGNNAKILLTSEL